MDVEFNNNVNNNNNKMSLDPKGKPGVPQKPKYLKSQGSRDRISIKNEKTTLPKDRVTPRAWGEGQNSTTKFNFTVKTEVKTNTMADENGSSSPQFPRTSFNSKFSTPQTWRPAPKVHQRIDRKSSSGRSLPKSEESKDVKIVDGETRKFSELKSIWDNKNSETTSVLNTSNKLLLSSGDVHDKSSTFLPASVSLSPELENDKTLDEEPINSPRQFVQSSSFKDKSHTWHYVKVTSPTPEKNDEDLTTSPRQHSPYTPRFSRISTKKFTFNQHQSPRPFKSFSVDEEATSAIDSRTTHEDKQSTNNAKDNNKEQNSNKVPEVKPTAKARINAMPLPPKDYEKDSSNGLPKTPDDQVQAPGDNLKGPVDEYVDIWNKTTPPIEKQEDFDYEEEFEEAIGNLNEVVAPPVPIRDDLIRGRLPSVHNYTPMAGNPAYDKVVKTPVVPPATSPQFPVQEYFEIDSDPEALVINELTDQSDKTPPPLPPTNKQGKRSVVNKNKKLNYIEVDTPSGGKKSGRPESKTSYTNVVIGSPDLRGDKKSTKSKSKLQLFGTKSKSGDRESYTTHSAGEDDHVTDFNEERNKKKRKSFGLTRKKANKSKAREEARRRSADTILAQEVMANVDARSVATAIYDSGIGTNLSATSSESTRSLSGQLSSTSSSTHTSGDGQVTRTTASNNNETPIKQMVPFHQSSKSMDETKTQPSFLYGGKQNNNENEKQRRNTEDGTINSNRVASHLHGPAKPRSVTTGLAPIKSPTKHSFTIPTPPSSPPPMPKSLPQHKSPVSPSLPSVPPPMPPVVTNGAPQIERDKKPDRFRSTKHPNDVYTAAEDVPTVAVFTETDSTTGEPVYDAVYEPGALVKPAISRFSKNQRSKFIDSEPLYQEYRDRTLSHASYRARSFNRSAIRKSRSSEKDDRRRSTERESWKSELMSEDTGTSTLWKNIPEVQASGIPDTLSQDETKLQQAQFEVITSQASYLRSLNILKDHFMNDWAMKSTDYLPLQSRKELFSNTEAVYEVELRLLQDLEEHFWAKLKLTDVCDIIVKYATKEFSVYVRYIQNNAYQERTLTKLQQTNDKFAGELCRLESSPACNKLPLGSFLLLPMQRVTRLPLLISAIVGHADTAKDKELYTKAKACLTKLNKLVKECNEGARKMQQTEQLAEIASNIEYSPKVRTFALVSQSRALVKRGELTVVMKKSKQKLHLFLFTDVLLIARKKVSLTTETKFEVIEWAKRAMLYVNERAVSDSGIFLVLLENSAGKRIEITIMPSSQNEISRWSDALSPQTASDQESIYESWDAPQFVCVRPYIAQQPDELSIDVDEIFKVVKKTNDGWLEGERLRDNEIGWFPADHCQEIEDEHVRARNLRNLYISPQDPPVTPTQ